MPGEKSSANNSIPHPERNSRNLLAGLLLAVGTLILYNPVAHFDFINFDDDRYVFNNRHILRGLNWQTIAWAFRTTQEANWHPITWLSHALDCQLFGLNPAGHHYVNLLLHVCNVVLLFVFLNRATAKLWRSFAVAALFAVHPLNVESVAWVAERKNVLCTLFFFLTLLAYLAYVRRPSAGRYFAVAAFFALGLMAKPMVITLPFVLLLLDYWPLGRMNASVSAGSIGGGVAKKLGVLIWEKAPLFLLALGSAIITVVAQRSGGAVSAVQQVSMQLRFENAVVSYARYIEKAIFPIHLAPLYPFPLDGISFWMLFAGAVVLLVISLYALFASKQRYWKTGWLWLLGTLVPVIGLVQVGNQSMADRYAYIPMIGLFILIVWRIGDWLEKRSMTSVAIAILVLAIGGLSLLTSQQLGYWKNSIALWTHTLAVTDKNFVAEDNLGNALVFEGKDEEALPHFQSALQINREDPIATLNMGNYYQRNSDWNGSVGWYQRVLGQTAHASLRMQAYTNLGTSYRMMHRYHEARDCYWSALQIDPNATFALVGLGLVEQKTADLDEAIENYQKAVVIQPSDVVYLLLAQALERKGSSEQAQTAFSNAEGLSRNIEQARQTADGLLAQ